LLRALLAVDAPVPATPDADEAWLTRVVELDREPPNVLVGSLRGRPRAVAVIVLVPEPRVADQHENAGVETGD
jgi:hypothetical protein